MQIGPTGIGKAFGQTEIWERAILPAREVLSNY